MSRPYSPETLAVRWGCSAEKVRLMYRHGELAGFRLGKPITQRPLRDELQAFTRALGVETVPHGLRKNAVNSLLEAGCTIAEVAAITGQTFQIVEHYAARVNTKQLGSAAILKLEKKRQKGA